MQAQKKKRDIIRSGHTLTKLLCLESLYGIDSVVVVSVRKAQLNRLGEAIVNNGVILLRRNDVKVHTGAALE